MTVDDSATPQSRQLSAALLIGMLTVPLVVGLLLFRKGYPRSLRRTAFAYTVVMTIIPIVARLGAVL